MINFIDAKHANGYQATSITLSYTVVATASNTILIAHVALETPATISSVTYNGVGMTLSHTAPSSAGLTTAQYIYYMLNPTSGTHDLVVTTNTPVDVFELQAMQLSGVRTISGGLTTKGNTSPVTNSITTVYPSSWLGTFFGVGDGSPSAQNGQTQRVKSALIFGTFYFSYTQQATTPTLYTSSFNTLNQSWVETLYEIEAMPDGSTFFMSSVF